MNEFNQIKCNILKCRICSEHFGFEPNPVFFGSYNSKIVQISQAPSKTVHETSRPFNDASGKKLRNDWYQISDEMLYNPDNFYITSLAHCYPGKTKNGGDKLPPKICFETHGLKELKVVNNKIYIVIGSHAAKRLFPSEKFDELVFKNNTFNGKLAIILPHPSPLNIFWFKNHPEFEDRLVEVRKIIKEVLS